jgi:DNA-binding IclR family transcriptional regulator
MVVPPTHDNRCAVPALAKGLAVLELFAESGQELTLSQIAKVCGRSISELQRVVPFLELRGYLIRNETGVYRLGSKLFRLANAHPPFKDLLIRALPLMRAFSDRTGESVHISTIADNRLLILGETPGTGYLQLAVRVGSTHDPTTTISGQVFLAHLGQPEALVILGQYGQGRAALPHLEKIRRQGYEFHESYMIKGVFDLAVPVLLPGTSILAVLVCSWVERQGLKPKIKRLLPALNQCAAALAAAYEPIPEQCSTQKVLARSSPAHRAESD